MKVVIIDDEIKIVKTIQNYLSENLPKIKIVGSANSVVDGIKIIDSENPDLVLLDIEMPNANGFDLLENYPNRDFDVIFITAYNQYAIEAFRVNAIDYLLKPFDEDELINSINKIKNSKNKSGNIQKINDLINQINDNKSKRIKIITKTGIEYIDLDTIIKIEADGNYAKILLENSKVIYATKKIKDIEKLLPGDEFFRSHKSHLVNLKKVVRFNISDNTITMSDNSVAALSRNKRDSFLENMERFI